MQTTTKQAGQLNTAELLGAFATPPPFLEESPISFGRWDLGKGFKEGNSIFALTIRGGACSAEGKASAKKLWPVEGT